MGPSVNREWGTLHFRVQFGSSPNFLSISICESSIEVVLEASCNLWICRGVHQTKMALHTTFPTVGD